MSKYTFFGLTPEVIGAMIIAHDVRSTVGSEWPQLAARPANHMLMLSRMVGNPVVLEATALSYSLEPEGTLPILYDYAISRAPRGLLKQLQQFDFQVDEAGWRKEQKKRLKYLQQNRDDNVTSVLLALYVTELLEFLWVRSCEGENIFHQPDIHWLYFTKDLFGIYETKYLIGYAERPALGEWKKLVRDILGIYA